MESYDFVVVGAGVVGLTLARELRRRKLGRVLVLEKEPRLGLHSSGRNSGVLHSGIYYPPGTLKAELCVRGAKMLRQYLEERGLHHLRCGKVIVAQRPELSAQIPLLQERARANGVETRLVDEKALKELEPLATSFGPALFSPGTWIFDPKEVLEELTRELKSEETLVNLEETYQAFDPAHKSLKTSKNTLNAQYLINAGGLWADQIAHELGVGLEYRILPFRGTYLYLKEPKASQVRGMIYPVPDLQMPFLGVHLTRATYGKVSVGPTAMPALGRENYHGLEGIRITDSLGIASQVLSMALINRNKLRNHMFEEIRLHQTSYFEKRLRELAPSLSRADLEASPKVGLRAQLTNVHTGKLEMDFIVKPGPCSYHVLNAVSPAFSSSLAFAEMAVDKITEELTQKDCT